MRAIKRTVSVLLSLMLVLGMVTMGISVASAAETKTITYTSNIGSAGTVTYTPGTSKQVTVTYTLKTSTTVINTQGVVTFDPAVLKVASGQSEATVLPTFNSGAMKMVNLTKTDGRIPYSASDFQNGFDFSAGATYLTVTFDIIGSGDTTVNLSADVITGTSQLNTSSANDIPIVNDKGQLVSGASSTSNAKVTGGDAVDFSVFLNRYGSNLEGKVGLVYVFNKAPAGYDTSKLTVSFSGPDDSTGADAQNVTVKYTNMTAVGNRYLRHDYSLKSTMFSQPITATINYNGEYLCSDTYSIEQYILDKPAADEISKKLNYTLLNYGAYAQLNFDAYTDNLANKNIDYPLQNVTAADIVLPSGVGTQPNLSALGLSFWMEGAELEADTAIRVYYKVTDANKFASAKATYNGSNLPFTSVNSTRKYLNITNISSADFDTVQEIKFSNGASYKTSILAQLKNKLTNNADDNLAKAMYWYNQAANAYFEG